MGRIRQKEIKNTANELINRFSDDLGTDFKENRKFIKSVLRVQGKLLMNRISGYVTHIVKIKKWKGWISQDVLQLLLHPLRGQD